MTTNTDLLRMIHASPAIHYVANASGDYGAIYVSNGVKEKLGYTPEQFTRDTTFWLSHIHPDDRTRVLNEIGTNRDKGHLILEYRFLHADGGWRWMHDEFVLARGTEGCPDQFIGSWLDITERKYAEMDQERLAWRLNEAQRIAAVGSWEVDLVTQEIWWSDETYRIFGEDPTSYTVRLENFLPRIHPEDRQRFVDTRNRATVDRQPYSITYRVRLRNGRNKIIRGRGHGVRRCNDTVVCFTGTVEDITEGVEKEEELRKALSDVEQLTNKLRRENTKLRQEIGTAHKVDDIVGDSCALKLCLEKVRNVASTDVPVLIAGETGTGKELIARAIHNSSSRRDKRMVSINCAAIPATLVESELFGHERGAFTGAEKMRKGRFELADGGTLFLDEIGDLPLELQGKLLRVLQEGEIQRIGGSETFSVDVRVIAATNRDLDAAVKCDEFRADLYYRISTFPVTSPSLREREGDIPLLAEHFVRKHAARFGKEVDSISARMHHFLKKRPWPGNVRELEGFIVRSLIYANGPVLDLLEQDALELQTAERESRIGDDGVRDLRAIERKHIVEVLDECKWVINGEAGAATALGLAPSTLRSKMKRLDIRRHPGSRGAVSKI